MDRETLKEKARQKGTELKEKAGVLFARGVDYGNEKVQATIADFDAMLPAFETAGFVLIDLDIIVSVPPIMAPCFRCVRRLSADEQAAALEGMADRKVWRFILKTLFETVALQDAWRPSRLEPYGIVIELGAKLPVTRIRYLNGKRATLLFDDEA